MQNIARIHDGSVEYLLNTMASQCRTYKQAYDLGLRCGYSTSMTTDDNPLVGHKSLEAGFDHVLMVGQDQREADERMRSHPPTVYTQSAKSEAATVDELSAYLPPSIELFGALSAVTVVVFILYASPL